MRLKTIGVVGFQGAGKDTVGDFLVDKLNFERDSFAKPLKDAVAAIFGWPRDMLEGLTKESRLWREQPDVWWEEHLNWNTHPGKEISERFTPRVALQLIGTEVMRMSFHDDIWTLSLANRLKNKQQVVVTDCRFPNELNIIKQHNGVNIRVVRGPEPVWFQAAEIYNNKNSDSAARIYCRNILEDYKIHPSEYAWIGYNFDYVIYNDGTLEELYSKIKEIL
jgi:hypothetical protein